MYCMGDGSQGDQEGGVMLPPSDFENTKKWTEAEIGSLLVVAPQEILIFRHHCWLTYSSFCYIIIMLAL